MRSGFLLLALSCVVPGGIAHGQVITEFPIPTAYTSPVGITAGPDGNVWFTEVTAGTCRIPCFFGGPISRITPDGTITEFVKDALGLFFVTFPGITTGPDGNLWFTSNVGTLGQITTTGVLTTFGNLPFSLTSITTGPDGNLWAADGDKIARITPMGAITELSLPTTDASVQKIVAGSDGNFWFTEAVTNRIGRITPAGAVTEFAVPTPNSNPSGIAAGPDGNVWFAESDGNNIGRITPTGSITEFPASNPVGIATGSDGNLWFTEERGNKIGRITPAGSVSEFALPRGGSYPLEITAGPDGNLWFTEIGGSAIGSGVIGRITTSGTPTCNADSHTLCLNNGRFSVTADFQQTPSGPSAPATAVPLTNNTGYFWFFDSTNIELVTKVLTGCSVNNSYWVFAGGLTDVGVQLTVMDTVTGAVQRYSNAVGTPFQPIQDSSAFRCP